MCPPHTQRLGRELAWPTGIRLLYLKGVALAELPSRRCLCSAQGEGFSAGRKGRSISLLGYQHCYPVSTASSLSAGSYAKGFSTALHGCLQVTGSYCNKGESGISFRGVYRTAGGTTRRLASCLVSASAPWYYKINRLSLTIRVEARQFQLSRTPSRSSTSLH